jgi:Domain of unknown function (DUF5658)
MNITPISLLLSFSIADISVTLLGLGVGCFEVNPIVASFGWVALLSGKLTVTLFVSYVLGRMRGRLGWLAFVPGLVMAAVVLWNVLNITVQLW